MQLSNSPACNCQIPRACNCQFPEPATVNSPRACNCQFPEHATIKFREDTTVKASKIDYPTIDYPTVSNSGLPPSLRKASRLSGIVSFYIREAMPRALLVRHSLTARDCMLTESRRLSARGRHSRK